VRLAPIGHAVRQRHCTAVMIYSITSSARASSVVGISRPSTFAVCKLMTNSNLGRQQHGQVGRPLTLENAAGIGLAYHVCNVRSVAHQPAHFNKLALPMECGHGLHYRLSEAAIMLVRA
jgi:hypothetical protein